MNDITEIKELKGIKEFSDTEAGLAELEEKYAEIPDGSTKIGYELLRVGCADLRGKRTGLDKMRLALNKDDQDRIKFRNKEAARIVTRLVALEDPMKEAKKFIDDEADRLKAEETAKEVARVEKIEESVRWIKNAVHCSRTVSDISFAISQVKRVTPEDGFDEFSEAANIAKGTALNELEDMLVEATEQERQAELVKLEMAKQEEARKELHAKEEQIMRQKAEDDQKMENELAVLQKEREEIQAERDAMERAKQIVLDSVQAEKEREEREKIEEGERVAREIIEAEQIAYEKAMENERKEIEAIQIKEDRKRFNKDAVVLMGYSGSLGTLLTDFHSFSKKCEIETNELIDAVMHKLDEARTLIAESPITKSQGW